ncbi:MAG: signal peptidase II [Alistipes sp.]|nr:signal peptidase II [Alistipes sp.]
MNRKKNRLALAGGFLCIVLLTALDQLTKAAAVKRLSLKPYVLIDGVFEFHYTQNYGSAWGMLSGRKVFLIVVTLAVMALGCYAFVRTPKNKKYFWLTGCEVVLLAGALGNFIDRVTLGYVRDFLYFSLIDFPIFNVADCYVVISAVIACILVIFVYEDEDFSFLSLKKKGSS